MTDSNIYKENLRNTINIKNKDLKFEKLVKNLFIEFKF